MWPPTASFLEMWLHGNKRGEIPWAPGAAGPREAWGPLHSPTHQARGWLTALRTWPSGTLLAGLTSGARASAADARLKQLVPQPSRLHARPAAALGVGQTAAGGGRAPPGLILVPPCTPHCKAELGAGSRVLRPPPQNGRAETLTSRILPGGTSSWPRTEQSFAAGSVVGRTGK